jgi:osmotically-inducible protein OsmY
MTYLTKMKMPTYALIAALLTSALSACSTYPRSGLERRGDDARITADLRARFDYQADLGAPNVLQIQTLNRVVYLSGSVSTPMQREKAELIARDDPDVTAVENTIGVNN